MQISLRYLQAAPDARADLPEHDAKRVEAGHCGGLSKSHLGSIPQCYLPDH
jgi:hypothetical protein